MMTHLLFPLYWIVSETELWNPGRGYYRVIRNEKLKQQSVLQRIQRKTVADSCDWLQ